MLRAVVVLCALCQFSEGRQSGRRKLTEYTIDLDKPPEERFLAIVPQFNATLWGFYRKYFEHDAVLRDVLYAISLKRGDEPDEMQRELKSMADASRLPLRWVMALQMLYELQTILPPLGNGTGFRNVEDLAASMPPGWEALARLPWRGPGCTGIIAQGVDGVVIHARNLDFSPVSVMKDIIYTGIFTRGGKEVFRSQMAAGYSPIITAMRGGPDGYALERNTRFTDYAGGAREMFGHLLSGRPLNGWTLRQILTTEPTYGAAVAAIAAAPFVSTEYSIVSGVRKGTILAKSPDHVAHTQTLGRPNFEQRSDYIIMTNFDFYWHDAREWLDPSAGVGLFKPRRIFAQRMLNATALGQLTPQVLFDVLNARGVIADTIFQAIMSVEKNLWNVSQPDLANQ